MPQLPILLFILFSGIARNPHLEKIGVNLLIQGDNQNIKDRITSRVMSEINSISTLKVSNDDNATFTVTINESVIECSNTVAGISMASILTRKITDDGNHKAQKILSAVFNTLQDSEIEPKCRDIIAKFDVNYFEK